MQDLYTLIANVSKNHSGGASQTYSADIQPIIHITGTVDNKPIDATFSPVLPFTVTQTTITLNAAVAPAPPGATYVAPSASTALAATVSPTQTGSIPHLVSNEDIRSQVRPFRFPYSGCLKLRASCAFALISC